MTMPPRTPPKSLPLPEEPLAAPKLELPPGHVQCELCQRVVRQEGAALSSGLEEQVQRWVCGRCIQDEEEARRR